MLQDKYPFRMCDISLPQCNTRFVYFLDFLISIPRKTFVHIGNTNCLLNRFRQHNSGYGSSSTTPTNLRPFAILGFTCGFDNNNDLILFFEEKWKMERNCLIPNNIEDPCELVKSGNTIIQNLDWQVYQNV